MWMTEWQVVSVVSVAESCLNVLSQVVCSLPLPSLLIYMLSLIHT